MCGISLVLSEANQEISSCPCHWWLELQDRIHQRGPDYLGTERSVISLPGGIDVTAWLAAAVLAIRGVECQGVQKQPIPLSEPTFDSQQDFFLWNGEIFSGSFSISTEENDGAKLVESIRSILYDSLESEEQQEQRIVELFSSIHGPYAFIFVQVIIIYRLISITT